jgi:signal transduction histidine kinase
VAPKALVLASGLLLVAAAGAAVVGHRLARPVERELASLHSEVAWGPYSPAFLRDAWHDLKTPLAAIRATVEVLEDGALEDPVAARRFVANLSRAAGELDRMLADLVTLARMETATLDAEQATSVAALIANALDSVAPLAAARHVSLHADAGDRAEGRASVRCDTSAMTRALSNLLENAVDATPGGEVRVSVAIRTGRRGALLVDVVNEPASVARDVRGHLFERATAGARGTGLGLAIARAAIEAHGGSVRFVELGPPRVRVRVELPR